eukprot:3522865-Ditylum_brightwellii.AAC.1
MEYFLKTGGPKAGSEVDTLSDDYYVGYCKSVSTNADFYTRNNTMPIAKNNTSPTEKELIAVATFSRSHDIT